MMKLIVLACLVVVALSAPQGERIDEYGPPQPYEFTYSWTDEYGNTHSRSESGDTNGNIQGVYETNYVNGQNRKVEYRGDGTGFFPTVNTNEAGTGPEAPADTIWNHQEPPAGIYEDRGPRPRGTYRK